jgi:hypothetical protein
MTAHFDLLVRYKRTREVRFRLNNLLIGTIPKKTLEDCGRKLGLYRKGTLVFGSEEAFLLRGGQLPAAYLHGALARPRCGPCAGYLKARSNPRRDRLRPGW